MNNEKNDHLDYEAEILKLIKNSLNGVSITDIANEKNFSRNTVAKYVALLEHKKLIYKKKIGSSKLLFSVNHGNLPSNLITSYYKMLLKGLKENYPSDGHIMKKIGKEGSDFIKALIPPRTLKQLKKLNSQKISQVHVDIFKNLYTSFDVLQPDVKLSVIEEDYENQQVLVRFTNSVFLDGSDDLIYHAYVVSGIGEAIMSLILKRNVEVNIRKIHVDREKKFSYFDMEIKADLIV